MALLARSINVDNTATRITTDTVRGSASRPTSVAIKNLGVNDVFLNGTDGVSTSGWPVEPGESYYVDLIVGEAVWAITAGTTENVRVAESHI